MKRKTKSGRQLQREIDAALVHASKRVKRPRRHHLDQSDAPTIVNRDMISSRTLEILGDQLDDAALRAARAGAVGDLEYQGSGMTGIVLCDERGTAFKVARSGAEDMIHEESEWMEKAAMIPGVRDHVARNVRYDKKNRVLIRECVQGKIGGWKDGSKLRDLHESIGRTMEPYGWTKPEFKEDSYVFARGRGPILIDASMGHRVGTELVRYAQDVLAKRRTPRETGSMSVLKDLAFSINIERGRTVPAKVADKLIAKIKARGVDVDF